LCRDAGGGVADLFIFEFEQNHFFVTVIGLYCRCDKVSQCGKVFLCGSIVSSPQAGRSYARLIWRRAQKSRSADLCFA